MVEAMNPSAGIGMIMAWSVGDSERTFAACERTITFELSGNRFLIETERYDGFKTTLLKLIDGNVTFIEIMGHETIALGYLSKSTEGPFSNSSSVETIDRRELFFHPDGYRYRVTLEARVDSLRETLRRIRESGSRFEMIYDF